MYFLEAHDFHKALWYFGYLNVFGLWHAHPHSFVSYPGMIASTIVLLIVVENLIKNLKDFFNFWKKFFLYVPYDP